MSYIPKPMNTSDIFLSDDINNLAEQLAKNTHEVWSQGRLDDGWRWGKELNMDTKTHPSLIPYEDLSESEKDFDRRTSQEAIKFLIKSGYKVIK